MSIAEKLTTIADNQQKVFDAGKKAEYDAFWDKYQSNGGMFNHQYGFAGGAWTDETYNPKYDIYCTVSQYMFHMTRITDTKVKIIMSGTYAYGTFSNSTKLKTIRLFSVVETTTSLDNAFVQCTALENLTMGGTIGKSINLQWSPLSVESMKSVISCLKNYSGTESEYVYTISFAEDCKTALEAEGATSPNGNTWLQYIDDLCWLLQ